MHEFFLAEVRKRANSEMNMAPQAIAERRTFSGESDKDFAACSALFAGGEIPDDPAACPLAGTRDITLEWTTGPSSGQIDFYGAAGGEEEPQRFLSLYFFSGADAEADRAAMRSFESYADFSQCQDFPLVLMVTDDPLSAAWQHEALQSLRKGITPLAAAFLAAYFPAEKAPVAG